MCGCNKGSSSKRVVVNGNNVRVSRLSTGPQSVQGGPAAGATPEQIRALGLQNNTSPQQAAKINADQRKLEKIRREAIRRALNK